MSLRSLIQAMHWTSNKTHKTIEWLNLIGTTMFKKKPHRPIWLGRKKRKLGCVAAIAIRRIYEFRRGKFSSNISSLRKFKHIFEKGQPVRVFLLNIFMSLRSLIQGMHWMSNKTHKTIEWLNLIGTTRFKKNPP